MQKTIIRSSAFLSGCLPMAILQLSWTVFSRESNILAISLSTAFLFLTILSAIIIKRYLTVTSFKANSPCKISNIKMESLLGYRMVTCYILPFIFLIGSDMKNIVALFIITLFLLSIFNNVMTFINTPILMFLGYSVLNCKISNTEETFFKDAYIIVESKEITSFNLSRYGFVNHIEEGIYFFRSNDKDLI